MVITSTTIVFIILCTHKVFTSDTDYDPSQPSIVIIGAGASGIAAASKLLDNGKFNIHILEAEGRKGGRVNSVRFGDAYIDLGAEWIHGQVDNVVYEMASQYSEIQLGSGPNMSTIYYSNGKEIDEKLAKEITNYLIDFLDREDFGNAGNISKGEFFDQNYASEMLDKYKNNEEKLKILVDAIPFIRNGLLSDEAAFSWYELPLTYDSEDSPGDQHVNWNGWGYKTIIEILMKRFPKKYGGSKSAFNKVIPNTLVTKIDWENTDGRVLVHCAHRMPYSADHVIFTPSLGVLKHDHLSMFNPILSHTKQRCIEALGFGAVMKVPLWFPQKWWEGEFKAVGLIWTTEDRMNLPLEFPMGPIKNGQSWLTAVAGLLPAENNPHVLIMWFVGPFIPELEQTSLDVIKDGVIFILNKFFGKDYNVTEPNVTMHSEWFNNPHFRGTWSYETLESQKFAFNCYDELAESLWYRDKPVLIFAGEATNSKHPSTVHGAIETGYRAADKILEFYI